MHLVKGPDFPNKEIWNLRIYDLPKLHNYFVRDWTTSKILVYYSFYYSMMLISFMKILKFRGKNRSVNGVTQNHKKTLRNLHLKQISSSVHSVKKHSSTTSVSRLRT